MAERLGREGRNTALPRNARNQLGDITQERQLRGQIDQPWRLRSEPSPSVDMPEGVRAARTASSFVVVRQELSFVGGHIDADRAVALAPLAGEAQIERVLHVLVAPTVLNHISLGHLPQQVGAASGRVFFLASHAKTGTHDSTFIVAAFAYSDVAQCGVRQAALIFGKLKVRLRLPRLVVGAQTKILIQLVGFNYFARVHLPVRVPQCFELPKSLYQFRAKHSWQQLGPRLAVAVFTGKRSAIADDQIGSLFHELAEVGDAWLGLQIEVHAHGYAGVSEVPIESAPVAIGLHHLLQIAKIVAELVGSDGGILPTLPARPLTRHVGGGSQGRFPDFPDCLGLLLVGEQAHLRRVWTAAEYT